VACERGTLLIRASWKIIQCLAFRRLSDSATSYPQTIELHQATPLRRVSYGQAVEFRYPKLCYFSEPSVDAWLGDGSLRKLTKRRAKEPERQCPRNPIRLDARPKMRSFNVSAPIGKVERFLDSKEERL
jgi:hypothetical protein